MPFLRPVSGPIGARFGQEGEHWANKHTGLDFKVPTGTPVKASDSGTLRLTPGHPAYGIYQDIDHGNGIVTRYAHLSRKARFAGSVRIGEIIGYSGATGNVTGSHLHFEVIVRGIPRDPENYLGRDGPPTVDPPTVQPPNGNGDTPDFSNITSGDTWIRVAEFIGGGALVIVGGIMVFRRL